MLRAMYSSLSMVNNVSVSYNAKYTTLPLMIYQVRHFKEFGDLTFLAPHSSGLHLCSRELFLSCSKKIH